MRAVQITRFGGPEVLDDVDLHDPTPAEGPELFEVSSAAINYAGTHRTAPRLLLVQWRSGRQNGAMPSVQIKDVPAETHAVLRRRAAAAHQSLQEYLRGRLIEEASHPTVEEVLARAGGRAGGSAPLTETTAAVRDDRDRR
jgi:plasmid stability protein